MGEKARFIAAMLIFGSIGLFVKNINMSSSEIALFRGAIGSLFLILATMFLHKGISFSNIKQNFVLLILSGGAIGFNWIFLFEAYRYTTISNATVSYYFAPVFVMIAAPFILKERVTAGKFISIGAAMLGLFLVMNSGHVDEGTFNHQKGIMYGLAAAALYASVIIMNKFIKNLSGFETTVFQLIIASVVLVPYVYVNEGMNFSGLDGKSVVFILILGIVHTGAAYLLYFGSIKLLSGQKIAIFSYIDPISAVIFSALFLGEGMSMLQMAGGALILGSTLLEGINFTFKKRMSEK